MDETSSKTECIVCKKSDEGLKLERCQICFRYYCEECAFTMSGRRFCGHFCAEYFFFSQPEDEPEG